MLECKFFPSLKTKIQSIIKFKHPADLLRRHRKYGRETYMWECWVKAFSYNEAKMISLMTVTLCALSTWKEAKLNPPISQSPPCFIFTYQLGQIGGNLAFSLFSWSLILTINEKATDSIVLREARRGLKVGLNKNSLDWEKL